MVFSLRRGFVAAASSIIATLLLPVSTRAEQISICNGREYRMPDSIAVPCSQTWALSATCTSTELVHEWTIAGNKPGDHYIRPFADFPITVIGYEMVKLSKGTTDFFMIGGGHQPDAFLWMGPGEHRARWMMNPGLGHPWPSKQEAAANWQSGHEEMIDVHGSCSSPDPKKIVPVTIMLTVYYVGKR